MADPHQAPLPSAEQTRLALVRAGLGLFGTKGFDAASTREIAAGAGTNIASIAYHFGGKEGLRDACARHVVDTMRGVAEGALAASKPGDAREAEEALAGVASRMAQFIVARPEAGEIVAFVLRELSHPSPALDIIYDGNFAPVHRGLCGLWELATGEPADGERAKIGVFTMIGQVVYFRIAREAVLRRLDWEAIGPAEAALVAEVAAQNIRAAIRSRRERTP